METAGPRRSSKVAPEGMRVVSRVSGQAGKKRAEGLDGGAEVKTKKSDIG